MSKHYYTIGEVCNFLELEAHVIRYWEKEIPAIRPKKSGRQRRYTLKQIETLKMIKDLLYNQKYTIEGARQKIKSDKSLLENANLEAKAKQRLGINALLPDIASDLDELKSSLIKLKQDCNKLRGQ